MNIIVFDYLNTKFQWANRIFNKWKNKDNSMRNENVLEKRENM